MDCEDKDEKLVIIRETGLWSDEVYQKRLLREKKKKYIWPGILSSEKKQYLPWKTNSSEEGELIKKLEPYIEITSHRILFDAEKTYRSGRFQCREVTVEIDGKQEHGFVWTIYEGLTNANYANIKGKRDELLNKFRIKKIDREAKHDLFYFYENKLEELGLSSGAAVKIAERVFFFPKYDSTIPVKEGPAEWALDWEGYHPSKHGYAERFKNFKNESVNMGEAFFNDKYRYIRPEWKNPDGSLKYFTEAEFDNMLKRAYKEPKVYSKDLSGIIDTKRFTQDASYLYEKYKVVAKTDIWKGRFVYRDGSLAPMQYNIDFEAHGHKWRVSVDPKTGQGENFLRIISEEERISLGYKKMRFAEIASEWKGKLTNLEDVKVEGSTVSYGVSSSLKGLILQGVKTGGLTGGLITGFFGIISGFKQEGIVGALKGFGMGILVGGSVGGALGGVVALAARFKPLLARVISLAGFVVMIVAIVLEPSDIALDPQEWDIEDEEDKDGNKWSYRQIEKKGTFNPEYIPHAARIKCTDGTLIELGEEPPLQSSYQQTPITVFAGSLVSDSYLDKVNWGCVFTPEGSRMWWWQDLKTEKEYMVVYRDHESERQSLLNFENEKSFRFSS